MEKEEVNQNKKHPIGGYGQNDTKYNTIVVTRYKMKALAILNRSVPFIGGLEKKNFRLLL